MSASRDIGIKYSSKISSFDGGEGMLEEDLTLSLEEEDGVFFPTEARVFGQLRAVARLTMVHWKITSATVGNGRDNMLNGSKFLLE
jgi:hypothetical protein